MRRGLFIIGIATLNAVFALAQSVPAPPATPEAPETPQVAPTPPTARTPRVPRTPRAPRTVEIRGSYLGVDTRDVTPERVSALKLKSDKGVEILMVDSDAPAGKAGLKEHDVITTYNGKSVEDVGSLRTMIRDTAPGTKVNLGVVRDGKPMSVTAELADRKKIMIGGDYMIHIPRIEIPPMPEIEVPSFAMLQMSRRNGLMVENMTKQLGEFFGAKEGRGVLVRSVEKNSPAEMAGFKAGDVIIRVGSEQVDNMSDWNQLMRSQQAGKVPVTVIREKHESTFTLTVPERRGDRSHSSWNGFDNLDDMTFEVADLGQWQDQMAKAQKEWQKVYKDGQYQKEMVKAQKEMQKAQKEVQKSFKFDQKKLQKELQDAQKQIEKAMQDLRQQDFSIHIDTDDEEK